MQLFFSLCQQKQGFLETADWRQCSIKANLCILRTSFGLRPSFLRNAALNIPKCWSKASIFLDNNQGKRASSLLWQQLGGLFDVPVCFRAGSHIALTDIYEQEKKEKKLSPLA